MADPGTDGGPAPLDAPEPPRAGRTRRGRTRLLGTLAGGGLLVAAVAIAVGVAIRADPPPTPAIPPATPLTATGLPAPAAPSPAATASAGDAGAAPSARVASGSGRIAIVDASGALGIVDDRGGAAVSLAVPGVVFGPPAWSPDGTRIAVIGTGTDTTDIYVFEVPPDGPPAGGEPTVIAGGAAHRPFYLYWSPDGARVAYLANEATGISLRTAPADGGAPADGPDHDGILREGAPLYFAWEDPGRLLLHVGLGPTAFTGEIDLTGAAVGPDLVGTGDFRTAGAALAPRAFAYASGDDAGEEIVVASRDGESRQHLAVFGPVALAFDPAGDTLATIAGDAPIANPVAFPFGPLRLVDPDTGGVRTLIAESALAFFWSPDGRSIAALRLAGPEGPSARSDTTVTAAIARPLAAATPEPAVELHLTVVDAATGAVRSDRLVRLGNEFVGTILPYFDQYALSHNVWAPDSASLVLPLVDERGRTRATVVDADGTDDRPVAGAVLASWAP